MAKHPIIARTNSFFIYVCSRVEVLRPADISFPPLPVPACRTNVGPNHNRSWSVRQGSSFSLQAKQGSDPIQQTLNGFLGWVTDGLPWRVKKLNTIPALLSKGTPYGKTCGGDKKSRVVVPVDRHLQPGEQEAGGPCPSFL